MQTVPSPHDSFETTPVGSPDAVMDFDVKDADSSFLPYDEYEDFAVEDCLTELCFNQSSLLSSTEKPHGMALFNVPLEGPSVKSPAGFEFGKESHKISFPSPGPVLTIPHIEPLVPLSLDDEPEQYVPAEEYKHFNEAPFTSCRVPKSFVSPADLLPELAAAKAVPVDTVSQRLMSCEGGSSLPFGNGEGSTRSLLSIPPKDTRKRRYEWLSKYSFVKDADSRGKIADLESQVGKLPDPLSPDLHCYTSPLLGSLPSPLSPTMPTQTLPPHQLLVALEAVADSSGKRKRSCTRYNKINFPLDEVDKRGLRPPPQSPREGCIQPPAIHMPQLLLSALEAETEAKKKPRKRRRFNDDHSSSAFSIHVPFATTFPPAQLHNITPVTASSCSPSPPMQSPFGSGCDLSSPAITPTASPLPSPSLAPSLCEALRCVALVATRDTGA